MRYFSETQDTKNHHRTRRRDKTPVEENRGKISANLIALQEKKWFKTSL